MPHAEMVQLVGHFDGNLRLVLVDADVGGVAEHPPACIQSEEPEALCRVY